MGGYIGARAGSLSTTTVANVQDVTATDTTPEVTIINNTHEDTDGGREGKVIFKGQQSGGEESTLAEIQGSHDGTADDQKGDLIFKTNDGSDGASPTERMRIDSLGNVGIGVTPKTGGSTWQHIQFGGTGNIIGRQSDSTVDAFFASNYYINSSGQDSYIATGDAARMFFNDDIITFSNAGSGSADAALTFVERMRIDSSGNIGIRTSSPHDGGVNVTVLNLNGVKGGSLAFSRGTNSATKQWAIRTSDDEALRFEYGSTLASEAMRIDSSGNLLVGQSSTTTPVSGNTVGTALQSGGRLELTCDGNTPIRLNRKSSDGDIAQFRKDGTTVGSIGSSSSALVIDGGSGYTGLQFATSVIAPRDNGALNNGGVGLGNVNYRFGDIYSSNGTIQTSDENEKQAIASLTNAEITAATAISKLFKTYKWKDAVAKKGDDARTHTGVIAQQVEQAMTDAGLDASKYAFWCSNTWWEKDVEVAAVEAVEAQDAVYDDDGNLVTEAVEGVEAKEAYTRTDIYDTLEEAPEGATEHTRMGVRYHELLAFIGAATEQRLTSIEARLTALEG